MVRWNKLEAGMQEAKDGKLTPINWEEEHRKLKERLANWKWYDQLWWFVRHGLWNWVYDLKWRVPNWFQRANNGWGYADTWSLDYYLTKVLCGSLRHLNKYKHGCPFINETKSYDDKKWDEILNAIIATFDTARQISESDVIYLPTYTQSEAEWKDLYEKYNSIPQPYARVMTREECLQYELGWKYFQEYFFSLWD